jgi:hypothetical protein
MGKLPLLSVFSFPKFALTSIKTEKRVNKSKVGQCHKWDNGKYRKKNIKPN